MKNFVMKQMRKIIIALLVIVFTLGAVGCNDKNSTNSYIVQAAKSDYQIVIPENADTREVTAAQELQYFFKEATEITLPIIRDGELKHSAENKYFSIGQTQLVTSADITVPDDVKSQGFRIVTKDNTVFLLGKSSYGTLYAAYEYLNLDLNYEYYFTDVYSLDKGVTELKLQNFDITDSPDIDVMSTPNAGFVWHNTTNRNRFRCVTTTEWAVPANNNTAVHNIFEIINPKTFGEEHPLWFEPIAQAQACFSARGDEKEYQAMQDEFLRVIQKGLKESSANIFTISQIDNAGFCSCDACKRIANEYGANSAVLALLCNELVDKVYDWFETEEGAEYKRDFYLFLFAYQESLSAPDSSKIQLKDKVGVWIGLDSFKSGLSWEEDDNNKELYNTVMSWKPLTNNFMFWLYDVNFNNYFFPYDTSAYKTDFYKLMSELGVRVVNDQSQTQNTVNTTAWNNLKSYVSTKLRWNVNLNETELVKAFMQNCYHDAADTMYEIYISYKANWAAVKANIASGELQINGFGGIFSNMLNKDIFSFSVLEEWYNGFLKAFDEIKPLEVKDKAAYDKAYAMISAEIASPLYMLLKMYSAQYSDSTVRQMKADFKYYCTVSSINFYKDSSASGAITNLYKEMGI